MRETVIPEQVRWSEQVGTADRVPEAVKKAIGKGATKIELRIDWAENKPRFWFLHATRYRNNSAKKYWR